MRAEAGHTVNLVVGHGIEAVELALYEGVEKIAIPLLARRQTRPLADDEVARRLDDAALTRVVFFLRRRRAHDQTACHIGRALSEPRGRRIVRQATRADKRDAQLLTDEEFTDGLAKRAHAAERWPRVGRAVDEHRQHRIARK